MQFVQFSKGKEDKNNDELTFEETGGAIMDDSSVQGK